MGKEIKKFTKNKFTDVSAVSNGSLYDDDRVLYVEYTPVSYPFTLFLKLKQFQEPQALFSVVPLPSVLFGSSKKCLLYYQ